MITSIILAAFIVIDPNPMLGPNNDWAPLQQEYAACAYSSHTYFQYTTCTLGAYDRALHPAMEA